MASLNPDKGILSHGEELEREAMNAALNEALALGGRKAKEPCAWKSYETCRNCGLYRECYPLEVTA